MTYTPTVWADGDCVMAADMNNIENGVDRAQGDVMVLWGLTAAIPASDPLLIGRLYFATDAPYAISRDNGAGWDIVGYTSDLFTALGTQIVGTGVGTAAPIGIGAAGQVWTVVGGTAAWAAAGAVPDYARYYWGFPRGANPFAGSRIFFTDFVFLTPIDIPYTLTIDRLLWWTGPGVAGNARIGVYAEGAADTPAAGALQVESVSNAVVNARNCEIATVADTQLTAGQYYIGIMGDNAACQWYGSRDETANFAYQFNPHVYGAFPDPCPAVGFYSYIPMVGVRVKSIP